MVRYNVLGRVSNFVKNEPIKSYGIIKQLSNLYWLTKNYKYMGMRKHVKRAKATERKNSVLYGTACWGTKYKEKRRQLTSKAIDINFACDVLIWRFHHGHHSMPRHFW